MRTVQLVTADEMRQDEFFSMVELYGGRIDKTIPGFIQGVVEKRGAAIWLYFRPIDVLEHHFSSQEIDDYKKMNHDPKVIIAIDIGHEKKSIDLAKGFCNFFMVKCSNTILDDGYGRYLHKGEVDELEY